MSSIETAPQLSESMGAESARRAAKVAEEFGRHSLEHTAAQMRAIRDYAIDASEDGKFADVTDDSVDKRVSTTRRVEKGGGLLAPPNVVERKSEIGRDLLSVGTTGMKAEVTENPVDRKTGEATQGLMDASMHRATRVDPEGFGETQQVDVYGFDKAGEHGTASHDLADARQEAARAAGDIRQGIIENKQQA